MEGLVAHLLPVHLVAWVVFGGFGLTVGHFLSDATDYAALNALIILGLIASAGFAVAQGIAVGLRMIETNSLSPSELLANWSLLNEASWVGTDVASEIWISTGIGGSLAVVLALLISRSKAGRA